MLYPPAPVAIRCGASLDRHGRTTCMRPALHMYQDYSFLGEGVLESRVRHSLLTEHAGPDSTGRWHHWRTTHRSRV